MSLRTRLPSDGSFVALAILILLGLTHTQNVDASPVTRSIRHLTKRYHEAGVMGPVPALGLPVISDYPEDTAIIQTIRPFLPQSFVFWTEIRRERGGSSAARDFARQNMHTYIYDAFPPDFICQRERPGGEERSETWWPNYVDRVSRIYADQAEGTTIYLVTESMDGTRLTDTTWWRVERPTLIESGNFATVTYVNANDFNDQRKFSLTTNKPLSKRDGMNFTISEATTAVPAYPGSSFRFNWDGYGDDPNGLCQDKVLYPQYARGQCGVHIVQSNNLNPAAPIAPSFDPSWRFNVTLKDANEEEITNQVLSSKLASRWTLVVFSLSNLSWLQDFRVLATQLR